MLSALGRTMLCGVGAPVHVGVGLRFERRRQHPPGTFPTISSSPARSPARDSSSVTTLHIGVPSLLAQQRSLPGDQSTTSGPPSEQGVLLADEVGLGKTAEAGLVLRQHWAERRRRLLVISP